MGARKLVAGQCHHLVVLSGDHPRLTSSIVAKSIHCTNHKSSDDQQGGSFGGEGLRCRQLVRT